MNIHRVPRHRFHVTPTDPARYTFGRLLSLLVVTTVILGLVAVGLAGGARTPSSEAVGIGLVLLVAAMTIAAFAAMVAGDGTQLGPDPEQVIGRAAGART